MALVFADPRQRPRSSAVVFKEPGYSEIHRIADALEPKLRRAFLQAVAGLGEDVAIAKLEQALAMGDVEAAIATLPFQTFETGLGNALYEALSASATKGAKLSAKYLPKAAQTRLRFDLVNPNAVEWAKQRSGQLITQISDETRAGVRAIIAQGQSEGLTVRKQARLIRQHVGLTERDAKAVAKMRARLVEEENPNVDSITERYSQRLLSRRARLIAQTETIASSNAGVLEGWRGAQAQGLLSTDAKKKWIITPAEVCELCKAVAGEAVPINSPFSNGLDAPPRHPRCRCTVGLVFR